MSVSTWRYSSRRYWCRLGERPQDWEPQQSKQDEFSYRNHWAVEALLPALSEVDAMQARAARTLSRALCQLPYHKVPLDRPADVARTMPYTAPARGMEGCLWGYVPSFHRAIDTSTLHSSGIKALGATPSQPSESKAEGLEFPARTVGFRGFRV